ncbi:MBL fold metallo-hydrolase [Simplicispira suum]|uniref:MBL fold metallo-hydrolase n=1 Tax=Simplicispira suum TaxID=2109915 RepID=A0A2S0N250_9BURK|nr:MBL fold metallo-hydrolase [Simplicispira suum]AVO42196.1 MBL fold metallo-hydrolase [Simplicispira suum]MBW7831601.1 MBL fold metallo-hydrolase [Simplicispira suum]
MLRFCSLGSGSSGNASVVEGSSGASVRRLLIDCGFGPRQLAQRLARAGLACSDLDAIFITHEHSDHVGCALSLAQQHGIALWMSAGTHAAIGSPAIGPLLHLVRDGEAIDLGAFEALPFTVPHDAREPLQLRCSNGAKHLGIATDFGHATPHVLSQLAGCHALLLEANHDQQLLAQSAYPPFLKRRIGGTHGHLANTAAAAVLAAVSHSGLRQVVAAHLSERNNRPELVRTLFAQTLGWDTSAIEIADPARGTPWLSVG